ncbi:MAG: class I SAM-dependent methyltransferase [Pirellulaceae bacterium]|nr:class I SAM-dependent methyltransferase [Pirellulaceae bacterium]
MEQLFLFKERGLPLKPFPGLTDDQWGIKAHNRPWIDHVGNFKSGERIVEVGGAYSLLPEYLSEQYGTESWIIDDFGGYSNETDLWQRWGNPDDWIAQHPAIRYIKKPVGMFDPELPSDYFDCVFSVSTLEHIPINLWTAIFQDMLRITKPGGRQFHCIDIPRYNFKKSFLWTLWTCLPGSYLYKAHPMRLWKQALKKSGVRFDTKWPSMSFNFDASLMSESADVIFRFYPPKNKSKSWPAGGYSLLIEIHREA